MKLIDKRTKYEFDDVLKLACRENNNKRGFLFVNRLQGKHIPCNPAETVKFISELGELVKKEVKGNTGVLAFAETATAIGAIVASTIGEDTYYITTTRANLHRDTLVEFREEHSHAPEQLLYGDAQEFKNLDTLVFVDDEFTTCNTVMNCITELKNKELISENTRIVIASLSNCLTDSRYAELKALGYRVVYLFRFEKGDCNLEVESNNLNQEINVENVVNTTVRVPIGIEFRLGCKIKDFDSVIKGITKGINLNLKSDSVVLVVGTEECMYPAIKIGESLDDKLTIYTQSTTRSPIVVSKDREYPLRTRVEFESPYSSDRTTYLYNVKKYDKVIVVTDSKRIIDGDNTLIRRLAEAGNKDITIIRLENIL